MVFYKRLITYLLSIGSLLMVSGFAAADTCAFNQVCTIPANGSLDLQKNWSVSTVGNWNSGWFDYKATLQSSCTIWYPASYSEPDLKSYVTFDTPTFSPSGWTADFGTPKGNANPGTILALNKTFTLGNSVHATGYLSSFPFNASIAYHFTNRVNRDVMLQCMEYQETTPVLKHI